MNQQYSFQQCVNKQQYSFIQQNDQLEPKIFGSIIRHFRILHLALSLSSMLPYQIYITMLSITTIRYVDFNINFLIFMSEYHQRILQTEDKKYRFKLFRNLKIGEGTFAECFLGEDLNTQKQVAIKVLKNFKQQSYKFQNTMLAKFQQNPNIVQSYKMHFTSDASVYIIMEYCNGGTLADVMQYYKRKNIKFKPQQINQIMNDILNGYQQLVRTGIVHEDLKPNNILINDNIFKIGDFGLSQKIGTIYRRPRGTLLYIPMQKYKVTLQKISSSHQSDIYSIGIIFFEMIYFKHPYYTVQFQQYCRKRRGGYGHHRNDEKKYYNSEYLKNAKIINPELNDKIYDEQLLKMIDLMISHDKKKRPTFQELLNFFRQRPCMRLEYGKKNLEFLQINKENSQKNSILFASEITQSEYDMAIKVCNAEQILNFLQKQRFFTNMLDRLINPIQKCFRNEPKLEQIINKILIVNYELSKKTKKIIETMKKQLNQDQLALLQKKQNANFLKLIEDDIIQFKNILLDRYQNCQFPIDVDLELTKIACMSKHILEMLPHINEIPEESLKPIQNLFTLYNIHSLKNTLADTKCTSLDKFRRNLKINKKIIINKFKQFEISEDLYKR